MHDGEGSAGDQVDHVLLRLDLDRAKALHSRQQTLIDHARRRVRIRKDLARRSVHGDESTTGVAAAQLGRGPTKLLDPAAHAKRANPTGSPKARPALTSKKPDVVVTRKLPEAVEVRMMELFRARLNIDDHRFGQAELVEAVKTADVLVPTVTDRIGAAVLRQAGPKLKLIANFGTGVNHIDLKVAEELGITVTNTPGVLTEDTADLTMALILAAPRRITEGERLLRAGKWEGWGPTLLLGHRIAGQRLGILGMGRIGQAVARRARGFGLSVHYHNRHRVPEATEQELDAAYWEDLDQMLAHMDIISVNCPLTDETRHMLSAPRLARLQRHAVIVNTARGEIIDENALCDLLEKGQIGGAGLDVFAEAPHINPRLLKLDNIVLTPHMGSATYAGRIAMGEKVIINIKSFVDGNAAPDRVIAGVTN